MAGESDMKVERLDVGVNPPEDEDYILVRELASGGYGVIEATRNAALASTPFSSRGDALEYAARKATIMGLDMIYLQ